MASRTADGVNSAAALVNILSVHALVCPIRQYGAFSASQAAALFDQPDAAGPSFVRRVCRMINVFAGPTDDEWHQPLPPPKVAPKALAKSIVDGALRRARGCVLRRCGHAISTKRWQRDPKVLEREMTGRWLHEQCTRQTCRGAGRRPVEVVDLTHTLDPDFPVIVLPPEFGQCARFRMEEVSAYDGRGPAWKWHNISMNEHTGTHFDAPIHWVSGRDCRRMARSTRSIASAFVGPVVVIDCLPRAAARMTISN